MDKYNFFVYFFGKLTVTIYGYLDMIRTSRLANTTKFDVSSCDKAFMIHDAELYVIYVVILKFVIFLIDLHCAIK